jgi:Na+/phosphate symporter
MRMVIRILVAAALLIWGLDMLGPSIQRALYPLRLAAMP